MEIRAVCLTITILTLCVPLTFAVYTQTTRCCQCNSMRPIGASVSPQIDPSPFKIMIDPRKTYYRLGEEINVNLTADGDKTFRSFMIQARRIDANKNKNQPIGTFQALDDDIDAIVKCANEPYGEDRTSASTEIKPKKLVRLVWNPPTSFQGHIEFRATFIENDEKFWLKEKSRPLYDPNKPIPPDAPPKYIPPPIKSIDVSDCGVRKGCYRIPEGCREVECEYIFTWAEDPLLDRTNFEMSAITDGFNDRYMAVALSKDIYMGGDWVFECVHNASSGRVEVFQSGNIENENFRFNAPKMGIDFWEGSYNAGRLRCRFTRQNSVNSAEYSEFKITSIPYYILMARGPARRALAFCMDKHIIGDIVFYKHISNKTDLDERMSDIDSSFTHLFVMSPDKGEILMHGMEVGHLPVASPHEVDLKGFDDISGRARYHMVKAHACIMLIAWIFFAPIGLIWMKYYTTMWPNRRFLGERYWFVVHFNCAFWVVLLVIIGFVIILIEAEGYSKIPHLPGKAHPILGIIVFCCIILIPFFALLRCLCSEKHTCRPLGNWFYFLVWAIAFCLAIPNIFIGMDFGKAMVPYWLTWILCVFFIFHLICEVILEVHQCCTHKKNKERRKKYELQKKENPKAHIPEPWPAGRNFKRNVLFVHFLVCLIVVLISVITLAVA